MRRWWIGWLWVWCVSGILITHAQPSPPPFAVNDLVWSPDGSAITIATTRGIWLYDPADLTLPPRVLTTEPTASMAYNADGTLLAFGDYTAHVRVLDVTAPQSPLLDWQVEPFDPANPSTVITVSMSLGGKEGQFIAAATSRNVLAVYDLDRNELVWSNDSGNFPAVVRFSGDSKDLACGNTRLSLDLYDTLNGKIHTDWNLEVLSLRRVADMDFNTEGDRLLVGGDSRRVLALDTFYGEPGYAWDIAGESATYVDWSPDDELIGVVNFSLIDPSLSIVQILRAQNGGSEVARLVGHMAPIRGFAFSPDSTQAATIADDGTLRLWDVLTGEELQQTRFPQE